MTKGTKDLLIGLPCWLVMMVALAVAWVTFG